MAFSAVPRIPLDPTRLLHQANWYAVCLFALSAWSTHRLHRYVLLACLATTLLAREARAVLARDPMFRFGLVFAVYLALQSAWGISLFPDTAERQWLDYGRWLSLFGFLGIAWPLRAEPKRIYWVFGLAAVGLWAGMLRSASGWDIASFSTGPQTGFFLGAGAAGCISATVLLGLLVFSGRMAERVSPAWLMAIRISGLILGIHFSAYMLLASQTRSAWLALILAVPFVLLVQHRLSMQEGDFGARRMAYPLLFALTLLATGLLYNADSIIERTGPDQAILSALLSGDEQALTETTPAGHRSSFRERIHVLKFGIQKWLERPIAGWGTGSVRKLIETGSRPELFIPESGKWISHTHNSIVEIMLRFGMLGIVLLSTGGYLLFKTLKRAELPRRMPRELFLFGCGAAVLFGIALLTGSRLLNEEWQLNWMIILAAIYTYAIHPLAAQPAQTEISVHTGIHGQQ